MRFRMLCALFVVAWAQGDIGPLPCAHAAPFNHFYFVQITDTHFGSLDHDRVCAAMVGEINRLPMAIECVVHTGDIAADNMDDPRALATATSVLSRLQAPLHVLPGNHDIVPQRQEATLNAYRGAFSNLIQAVEHHGVVFIMVYTEPLRQPVTVEGYEPLRELEAALRAHRAKPILVFHHTPCVEDFYDLAMHPGWREDIRREWERLLHRYRVKAVMAGHFHRDELHWLGDIPLFVASSAARYWGRQPSFRIYEYRDGRLGYRTVYLETSSP
jgi:3',5'-cyclic AMP phosphodiesterase CpdA